MSTNTTEDKNFIHKINHRIDNADYVSQSYSLDHWTNIDPLQECLSDYYNQGYTLEELAQPEHSEEFNVKENRAFEDTTKKSTGCITAERIQLKRDLKRQQKIRRIQRAVLSILTIVAIGLTYYAFTEIMALKPSVSHERARASEVDPHLQKIYNCFATVGNSSLELALPGKLGTIVALGFHEAERKEAVALMPAYDFLNKETTSTVRTVVSRSKYPVLFVMTTRWRGSSPTSAVDIAMKDESDVYSPVNGIVRVVRTYSLYHKINDYHVEIEPQGYPNLRIAIIHIDNIKVREGKKFIKNTTRIGTMRALPQITTQINKYLPETYDHIHIQVNPANVNGEMGS